MSVIRVENAFKTFKLRAETVVVLNNFSMDVQQGKM
jgi:ABC-type glutathione transport system ATPase component